MSSSDIFASLLPFSFEMGSYGRVPNKKKSKKKKKAPVSCWWERCTMEELKQLLRAAKLAVSGTKGQLVERLCQGEYTSKYSPEYTVRLDTLKEQCREKGLQVSGKRFELVLRLLQNETGAGGEPKRAREKWMRWKLSTQETSQEYEASQRRKAY